MRKRLIDEIEERLNESQKLFESAMRFMAVYREFPDCERIDGRLVSESARCRATDAFVEAVLARPWDRIVATPYVVVAGPKLGHSFVYVPVEIEVGQRFEGSVHLYADWKKRVTDLGFSEVIVKKIESEAQSRWHELGSNKGDITQRERLLILSRQSKNPL